MTKKNEVKPEAKHTPQMVALLGIAAYIIDAARNRYIAPSTVLMHVAHDVGALAYPERRSTPRTLRYAEKAGPLLAAPDLLDTCKVVLQVLIDTGRDQEGEMDASAEALRAAIAKASGEGA